MTDTSIFPAASALHQRLDRPAKLPRCMIPCLVYLLLLVVPSSKIAAETNKQATEQTDKPAAGVNTVPSGNDDRMADPRSEILKLEKNLHAARKRQAELKGLLKNKNAKLSQLEESRSQLAGHQVTSRQALATTLLARYQLWRQPKLKTLLAGREIATLQTELRFHDYLLRASHKELHKHRDQLMRFDEIEAALKLEAQSIRRIRKEAAENIAALEANLRERNRAVQSLDAIVESPAQGRERSRAEDKSLSILVDAVRDTLAQGHASVRFDRLKGKLSWPTTGKISKAPGRAMRKGGAKWSGVIIASTPGSTVNAVASGRVAFAGWFRTLGLLLIIDHGDGYMSLYGHNQELHKKSGDWVKAGDIVATVGDSGGQQSTGLYFEIRHDGTAQDPRLWCKS